MRKRTLKELAARSRSCRRFDEGHRISEECLRELVELARLAPSAGNLQPLKFMLSRSPERNSAVFPFLKWAASLEDWSGPGEGERPSAYMIILGDGSIASDFGCDHGIAAQTILLGAAEKGLGGCMLGSIDREGLRESLKIPEKYRILLVVALGKPAEKIVVEDAPPGGGTRYYRDDKSVHHVPKRTLDELIIG